MTEQNFEQMRRAMVVSQLRTTGVNDPLVVDAMGEVARERFVPADKAPIAYADLTLPIAPGRAISAPMVTGRLLTEAEVRPGDKVLVVGAATGYAAAVLIRLGATVVALEEDAELFAAGQRNVPEANWVQGPLAEGSAGDAPFTLILIDGAVERIPAALSDQLADGGRLVGGLIDGGVCRLVLGVRAGQAFGINAFADVDAAPLPGFAPPPTFSF